MRAFQFSWFGFFMAFFIWFAAAPLLGVIQSPSQLNLTKQQIWSSSIASVGSTILLRFVNGPTCDKYGARITFAAVLCIASIPAACLGLANSAATLIIVRFFIGIAGSCFVMCQYWSTTMFSKEVVGTANALTGGWGNLGGGVTQLVMGSALYPLFKNQFCGGWGDGTEADRESCAWRTVSIVPATITFIVGICLYKLSDDGPNGNYSKLKKTGKMQVSERSER